MIVVTEKHQKQLLYSSETPFVWSLNLVTPLLFEEKLVLTTSTRQKKKRTTWNCSTLRKITSDRLIQFISVQRYVMYGCVTRVLKSGVEIVLKKIGHEQSGGQIVKSQEISVL